MEEMEEYFMSLALLTANLSQDPVTKVGACIVNKDNTVVSLGYNSMPKGCEFPWDKCKGKNLYHKKWYVCHAEMNAILNNGSGNVKDCAMYVALYPCNECAKLILQSGITKVVYYSDKHCDKLHTMASKRILAAGKIDCRKYNGRTNFQIDFDKIVNP